jgi:hypothetical protein
MCNHLLLQHNSEFVYDIEKILQTNFLVSYFVIKFSLKTEKINNNFFFIKN